jgi:hypothetical protein
VGIGLAPVGLEAERQLAVRVGDSYALNLINRGRGRTASVECRDCKSRDDNAQRYEFHGSSTPKTRSSGQVRTCTRNLIVSSGRDTKSSRVVLFCGVSSANIEARSKIPRGQAAHRLPAIFVMQSAQDRRGDRVVTSRDLMPVWLREFVRRHVGNPRTEARTEARPECSEPPSFVRGSDAEVLYSLCPVVLVVDLGDDDLGCAGERGCGL